jgi:hypothetical protein
MAVKAESWFTCMSLVWYLLEIGVLKTFKFASPEVLKPSVSVFPMRSWGGEKHEEFGISGIRIFYLNPNAVIFGFANYGVAFFSVIIELFFVSEGRLLVPSRLVSLSIVSQGVLLIKARFGSQEVLARRGSPAWESFSVTISRSLPETISSLAFFTTEDSCFETVKFSG